MVQPDCRIKLDQNENPYPFPEKLKQKIIAEWKKQAWNRYPRIYSEDLRNTMAEVLNLAPENLVTANGSNELVRTIFSCLLGPGRKAVMTAPSFSLYSFYAKIFQAEVKILKLQESFKFPVEEIIEHCQDPHTVLTVLCSPNNPTGNTLSFSHALRILEAAAGYVLIDEAYMDFCDQDFSGLSRQFDNLILIRTFSKAFCFARGRFGYGIVSAELVSQLYKMLPPYNLNGFIQTAVEVMFKNQDILKPLRDKIIQERKRLETGFSLASGVQVYPSEANFILVRPFIKVEKVIARLEKNGIRVRNVSSWPGLSNHIQITVGTPEENEAVVRVLSERRREGIGKDKR